MSTDLVNLRMIKDYEMRQCLCVTGVCGERVLACFRQTASRRRAGTFLFLDLVDRSTLRNKFVVHQDQ
jgi:hypothetical protein